MFDPEDMRCARCVQAFKMAEGTTLATQQAGTLGAQMLARTQAVSKLSQQLVDKAFKDWWEDQVRHYFPPPPTSTAPFSFPRCLRIPEAVPGSVPPGGRHP